MKELLSPAGNMECLHAAVNNGADAVYLSGKAFGARKFAGNFTNEELLEAVNYAHLYGVKVYVTVNTIIYNNEVEDFINYIDYLYKIGIDALIMQDIGMISLVRKNYQDFPIHASTQVHNHNNDGIKLLKEMGVSRIVLDREMTLQEIESLDIDIEKEVFIHGALCNSYSGCCLFSSMCGGRSGNRGECVQVCRLPFKLIKNNEYVTDDFKYLLSTKELNTTDNFDKLMNSSIISFKIEGRMKSPSYVGYVTRMYRKLIDNYYINNNINITEEEKDNLKILFNREFTSGYLFNDKVMNINSSNHQGLEIGKVLEVTNKKIKIKLNKELYQEDGIRFNESNKGMIANFIYDKKDNLINKASSGDIIYLDNKINLTTLDTVVKTSSNYLDKSILSINNRKVPIDIEVSLDNKLHIVFKDKNKNVVSTEVEVDSPINRVTTKEEIKEKLCKLGNTPFVIDNINIDIDKDIFVSMKYLNDARRLLVDNLINERIKINRMEVTYNTKLDYKDKVEEYEVSVIARTKEQVEASIKMNVNRIYVDNDLYEEYKDNPCIYLRLPRCISNYNYDSKRVLVTELGGIHKYQDKEVVSDYYLNVVNNYSIKYLLDHNVKRVTLSPEVDYHNLSNFIKDKIELIVYGRLELMLTKSCPIKEMGKCFCKKDDKYAIEDINKHRYPVLHSDCLTHIMHYRNIDYLDYISEYKCMGIRSFRLELFDEDYERVIELINKIRESN